MVHHLTHVEGVGVLNIGKQTSRSEIILGLLGRLGDVDSFHCDVVFFHHELTTQHFTIIIQISLDAILEHIDVIYQVLPHLVISADHFLDFGLSIENSLVI